MVLSICSLSLIRDADQTSLELVNAYFEFCNDKGWRAQSWRIVENQLPDLMLEVHGVNRRHDIKREGRSARGYSGITLCSNNPF